MPKLVPNLEEINSEFHNVSRALRQYAKKLEQLGSPVRRLTFNVNPSSVLKSTTKVWYRRAKKHG